MHELNGKDGWEADSLVLSTSLSVDIIRRYGRKMNGQAMIPIGYMLKSVASPAPEWIGAPNVLAVHSISGCVSSDFGDYIPLWQHNGWWLFDTPAKAREAAERIGQQNKSLELFYYEAFHKQFDDASKSWKIFEPEDFPTAVMPPSKAILRGFDVATFFVGTSPECSPLSCNGLAASVAVNRWCLFNTLEEASAALEADSFRDTEPGPYRIIAVYTVEEQAE